MSTQPPSKLCVSIELALMVLVFGTSGIARADTIPFSFSISADAFTFGTPSSNNLKLPTTVSGSGTFSPFGSAIYKEKGIITYMMLPSGAFVPASVHNAFVASFNAGTDTFEGTNFVVFGRPNTMGKPTFSSTLTIQGGTGIFTGASGSATANGTASPASNHAAPTPIFFSGSGNITASDLKAVPEPASITLLGTAILGLAGLAALGKKRLIK